MLVKCKDSKIPVVPPRTPPAFVTNALNRFNAMTNSRLPLTMCLILWAESKYRNCCNDQGNWYCTVGQMGPGAIDHTLRVYPQLRALIPNNQLPSSDEIKRSDESRVVRSQYWKRTDWHLNPETAAILSFGYNAVCWDEMKRHFKRDVPVSWAYARYMLGYVAMEFNTARLRQKFTNQGGYLIGTKDLNDFQGRVNKLINGFKPVR